MAAASPRTRIGAASPTTTVDGTLGRSNGHLGSGQGLHRRLELAASALWCNGIPNCFIVRVDIAGVSDLGLLIDEGYDF